MRRLGIWGVMIVVGLIVSYFTVSGKDAVKWNDRVVAHHRSFGTAWSRLQPHVTTWLQGKPVDAAQLDSALARYGKDVAEIAGKMRGETPPDDELCKSMHVELVKFADIEEGQLPDIRKLCGDMKGSNPGKPEDLKRAAETIDALGKKEMAQEAVVKAKQQAMAAKFKLKMK
ncbi:MAG TPA: hypothetical protein VJB14_10650 [Planctomycetota bacterium]|nr:hypothetical protein [Planctomycetota bacterium]